MARYTTIFAGNGSIECVREHVLQDGALVFSRDIDIETWEYDGKSVKYIVDNKGAVLRVHTEVELDFIGGAPEGWSDLVQSEHEAWEASQ